jgi:two-component system, NtrC family, sensor histidine kinase HydH
MKELDGESFQNLKAYVGFDAEAAQVLGELLPRVRPYLPAIVDDFYMALTRDARASALLSGTGAQVDRLKHTLEVWLTSLLQGPHDDDYLRAHSLMGESHVRMGLPQAFVFAAMNRLRTGLIKAVSREATAEAAPRWLLAVNQLLDLELAILLDAYRKSYVAQAQTSERLATIGQLAASIGHELRNPLGVIESSLFIVRQHLQRNGTVDERLEKHHDRIANQVQVCLKTIENLLDLARDRKPLRRRQPLVPLLELSVERSGVRERLQVDFDVPPELSVNADGDDLVLVLKNLLVNAAASPGARTASISAEERDGTTTIRVRDDGAGIAPEIRAYIFDALFTTKARGTGLGLALCRRILQAHGGDIELEPAESGACFRLWLPAGAA